MIGKRKRDTAVVSRSTAESEEEQQDTTPTAEIDSQDLFRKFFEAQFAPLDVPGGKVSRGTESKDEEESEEEEEDEESEEESDWDGLEEDEDNNKVEVVEHQDLSTKDDLMDKRARKAFMSGKVPTFASETKTKTVKSTPKNKKEEKEDEMDADDLKKDLALQRLLKESHLLEDASELDPTGKNRHKALDLRMQSLGANASLYKQKMPSSHRRGIAAKAEKKEDKRRKEAKENGIILEKPTGKSKPSAGRRERGVGGPSIGKFAGGTLNISKHDFNSVQGPPRKSARGRGGGRGRGRGRGRG